MEDFIKKEKEMKLHLLAAAKNAYERGWAVLALELIKVQKEHIWIKGGFSTFSKYVEEVSIYLKHSMRLIWRYRKAYNIFVTIATELDRKHPNALPEDISRIFSPDALELLDQFRQVMPQELFNKYCNDYFNETISRNDLRAEWKTFKKALVGKTPRRRITDEKQSIQHVDTTELEKAVASKLVKEALIEYFNNAASLIYINSAQWEGVQLPDFDALCIYQEKPEEEPVVHGIGLTNGEMDDIADKLKLVSACDYFWLAYIKPPAVLPKHEERVGLLYFTCTETKCDPPKARQQDTPEKLRMMRFLLTKCQA